MLSNILLPSRPFKVFQVKVSHSEEENVHEDLNPSIEKSMHIFKQVEIIQKHIFPMDAFVVKIGLRILRVVDQQPF